MPSSLRVIAGISSARSKRSSCSRGGGVSARAISIRCVTLTATKMASSAIGTSRPSETAYASADSRNSCGVSSPPIERTAKLLIHPLTRNAPHHQASHAGGTVPPERQMSLMTSFGRQRFRTGTNQPPIAHPVP